MDAITICAGNYLPFAKVLGDSFLDHNNDSTFSILVIDAERIEYVKDDRFYYLEPNDLDIPKAAFENMAFYYNVTELATALKPSAMKTLFARGSKKVIYLDPDIEVFNKLDELEIALEEHPIVLTPHSLFPIPRDGLRPTEADIMASGTFNLGFLGLSASKHAFEMLDWWEERLRFDSISDPGEMLFTDQKWIDLVPSYFPLHVIRHLGYNVAYWNLHERNLSEMDSNILVDEEPLKFFHFSGYNPDRPWILSKYVADNPRVTISGNSIIEKLCSDYADKAKKSGWNSEKSDYYGFAKFEDGKRIPSSLRRLYREDCIEAYRQGETLNPPENWKEWATQRSINSGNLSRLLFSVWKSRPDLKNRFPDATGTQAVDLQVWAKTHGISEGVIEEDFVTIGSLQNEKFPSRFTKEIGINVAGYLKGEFGLGKSARLILDAARHTGLPITVINSNRTTSHQSKTHEFTSNEIIYPITIVIVNADHFEFWVNDVGPEISQRTYIIGVWAWETEDFPASMQNSFKYVDEIWAVSSFVQNAIAKHTSKPVLVYPSQIEPPEISEKLNFKKLGIPENLTYNLFIFDYASVFNRKNPLGVVQSHKIAFPNADGPALVIKSMNGDKDAENRELLRYSVKDRKDIFLIEEYMPREQLDALLSECFTYISLHRSEGYGLTIAEALSLGKFVVATGYSGNLDFNSNENYILVPYNDVYVGSNSFPYSANSKWAEPDVEFAAKKIREIYTSNNTHEVDKRNYYESIVADFNKANSANFIFQRVMRITAIRGRIYLFKKIFKLKLNKTVFVLNNKIRLILKNASR